MSVSLSDEYSVAVSDIQDFFKSVAGICISKISVRSRKGPLGNTEESGALIEVLQDDVDFEIRTIGRAAPDYMDPEFIKAEAIVNDANICEEIVLTTANGTETFAATDTKSVRDRLFKFSENIQNVAIHRASVHANIGPLITELEEKIESLEQGIGAKVHEMIEQGATNAQNFKDSAQSADDIAIEEERARLGDLEHEIVNLKVDRDILIQRANEYVKSIDVDNKQSATAAAPA